MRAIVDGTRRAQALKRGDGRLPVKTSFMNRVVWRFILLAICALVALAQIAEVLDVTGMGGAAPWRGRWGLSFVATDKPFTYQIGAVNPGGPGARAGVHSGDVIDARGNTMLERLSIGAPLNGRPVTLSVRSGAQQRKITVVPRAKSYSDIFVRAFGGLWLLLFAAVIAWRRAEIREMRFLALWLAAFVAGRLEDFATPWFWPHIIFLFANIAAASFLVGLWAALGGCFARPLSRVRRVTQWCCYGLVTIVFAAQSIDAIGAFTLKVYFTRVITGGVVPLAALTLALLSSILAIVASRSVERQRALWTFVPLAFVLISSTLAFSLASTISSYAGRAELGLVSSIVSLAAPVALTYGVLSRRLIDTGFVLNRALIFTIVSAIVIGAFVLLEWAAREWLASTGHTISTAVGMGIAVGLGLSMRYIHKHVDHFVDRVFFRKRHEDEAALRTFAHESSYITDRATLLERAIRIVKDHTDATDAAILIRDGAAAYTPFTGNGVALMAASENDPGVLALRAWRKPLEIGALTDSVLQGELAFPMVSRGSLVGILVCAAKRNGEGYAPDESDALMSLAHGVGTALDVLSTQRDSLSQGLSNKMDQLHHDLQRVITLMS